MKCMRCGGKYNFFYDLASVMRCVVYLAKSDRYVVANGLELCPECTKNFLIWFGNGIKIEEDSE